MREKYVAIHLVTVIAPGGGGGETAKSLGFALLLAACIIQSPLETTRTNTRGASSWLRWRHQWRHEPRVVSSVGRQTQL